MTAPSTLIHNLSTIAAGAGCALLLVAGRREQRGDLANARRGARKAGFTVAAGTVLQIASAPWLPWAPLLFGSLFSAAVSGIIGLLAGLSGKPRPSASFAVAFWLLSLLCYLIAARL